MSAPLSSPRARAAALVGTLEPEVLRAIVQAALLAEIPESPAGRGDGPPHPDGWSCAALAARYGCSPSSMRERIAGGEFGPPDTEGGPRKRGRGWTVPHHQVLARDQRENGPGSSSVATSITSPVAPTAGLSLTDRRRRRTAPRPAA